jgi:transposase-like protein
MVVRKRGSWRRQPAHHGLNPTRLWTALGRTSDVLTRLIVEMYAGGRSQRDIESALEKALGQFVVSKSAVSDITDRREKKNLTSKHSWPRLTANSTRPNART